MKTAWLDRRIARPGPYLALCLSDEEFHAALRHIGHKDRFPGVGKFADATMHTLENEDGTTVCIVCLKNWQGKKPVEVAGLLVHEAVHVWQSYCIDIGEREPGREQEAYAIQCIAQELMAEFARRMEA
jgi:hypothetical protein